MKEYSNNPTYPDGEAYDPAYAPPTMKDEVLAIWQGNNCGRGCHWADSEKVGTGEPCCTKPTLPDIKGAVCLSRKE